MRKNAENILNEFRFGCQGIAMLIDPEKAILNADFSSLLKSLESSGISYVFVGGSTVTRLQQSSCIHFIREHCSLPIVIFPGSPEQICDEADAILLLNLISGRNPDFLIGHHVAAAQQLWRSNLEILPTAYILVDGGKPTAVQRISMTNPIPADDFETLLSTAMAGVLMGNKLIYCDAGSGALNSLNSEHVKSLKSFIDVPLIVGGGIRTIEQIEELFDAGANIIVIGNHIEQNPDFLKQIQSYMVDTKLKSK